MGDASTSSTRRIQCLSTFRASAEERRFHHVVVLLSYVQEGSMFITKIVGVEREQLVRLASPLSVIRANVVMTDENVNITCLYSLQNVIITPLAADLY